MDVFIAFSACGLCITAAFILGRSSTSTSTGALGLRAYAGGMATPKTPGLTGGTLRGVRTLLRLHPKPAGKTPTGTFHGPQVSTRPRQCSNLATTRRMLQCDGEAAGA